MLIYFYLWIGLSIMSFLGLSSVALLFGDFNKETLLYLLKSAVKLSTMLILSMEVIKRIATFLH